METTMSETTFHFSVLWFVGFLIFRVVAIEKTLKRIADRIEAGAIAKEEGR